MAHVRRARDRCRARLVWHARPSHDVQFDRDDRIPSRFLNRKSRASIRFRTNSRAAPANRLGLTRSASIKFSATLRNDGAKRKRALKEFSSTWDGTLIDSYYADASAYLAMFKEMGISWGIEELEKNYSPDWYQVYRSAGLPRRRWPDADRAWRRALCKASAEADRGCAPGAGEIGPRSSSWPCHQGRFANRDVRRSITA